MRELAAKHSSWSWRDGRPEVWTIAVIDGTTPDAVLEIYGGSENTRIGDLSYEAAYAVMLAEDNKPGATPLAQIRLEGSHVVVIEPTGFTGTSTKVALEASRHGTFLSVFDSTNTARFVHAEHGRFVANFNPFHIGSDQYPTEIVPAWVGAGAHFRYDLDTDDDYDEDWWATMIAAVEQATGLAFDPAWLQQPTPTYRITEPTDADLKIPPQEPAEA